MKKQIVISIILFIFTLLCLNSFLIGKNIDKYKDIPVYYNGILLFKSYGKNYSKDGYYYGKKWQCVEFIKRFLYDVKKHKMPDTSGNAKDYYDSTIQQGKMNIRRGLIQYKNGGNIKPAVDDILVFNNGKYGHVAIVCDVNDNFVYVIQQNVFFNTRATFKIIYQNGNYYIGTYNKPICWLRKL